ARMPALHAEACATLFARESRREGPVAFVRGPVWDGDFRGRIEHRRVDAFDLVVVDNEPLAKGVATGGGPRLALEDRDGEHDAGFFVYYGIAARDDERDVDVRQTRGAIGGLAVGACAPGYGLSVFGAHASLVGHDDRSIVRADAIEVAVGGG